MPDVVAAGEAALLAFWTLALLFVKFCDWPKTKIKTRIKVCIFLETYNIFSTV